MKRRWARRAPAPAQTPPIAAATVPIPSEPYFRNLLERLPLIVYIDGPNASSPSVYVSPQSTAILGYTPADWASSPGFFQTILHPHDRVRVPREVTAALTGSGTLQIEYRVIRSDGSIAWLRDEAVIVRDAAGTAISVQGYLIDITERKHHEAAREQSDARSRAMLDAALDAVVTIDHEDVILEFNAAAERIFGYARDDVVGKRLADTLIPPAQREAHARGMEHFLATGEGPVLGTRIELAALHADGGEFPIEISIVNVDVPGQPVFTAFLRDISGRKQREAALLQSEAIVTTSFDAIVGRTPEGIVTSWNAAAERIFGYRADEMIGRPISDLAPASLIEELDELNRRLRAGSPVEAFETLRVRKDGTLVDVESTISPIIDANGEVISVSAISRDITARRAADTELQRLLELNRYQSLHDGLTGLANRAAFRQRLATATFTSEQERGAFAVLLIDLDRFKEINDTLGHTCGDLLLVELATRLRSVVRTDETIARLGGDEFGMLVPDTGDSSIEEAIGRIVATVAQPFEINGVPLHVEASVGGARYPADATDVDVLLQQAEVAMYVAKEAGTPHALYTPALDRHDAASLALLAQLPRAIQEHELILHYQPKATVATGELASVEVLTRWMHPTRGLIPPVEFIPLAEQTALIHPMTTYVLNEALDQLRRWEHAGLRLNIAVNLSMRSLHQPELPEQIAELLRTHGFAGDRLTLEITESSVVSDPGQTTTNVARLAALGVTIAIDDFGTGYTSLALLARLAVRQLKIDRSFVLAMESDAGDAAIVRSIITLGHDLGLEVVAEGVETAGVAAQLASLGCDTLQGYYIGRPMPAPELTEILERCSRARHAA